MLIFMLFWNEKIFIYCGNIFNQHTWLIILYYLCRTCKLISTHAKHSRIVRRFYYVEMSVLRQFICVEESVVYISTLCQLYL